MFRAVTGSKARNSEILASAKPGLTKKLFPKRDNSSDSRAEALFGWTRCGSGSSF
jgi:hypothetical protein